MKLFRFRLLIAAMAVLMGTVVAKSQTAEDTPPAAPMHGHHTGMGMGGGHMGFFAKELNLTDDQKTQMKAIWQKEGPTMKSLFEQQHQIDLQLRQYVEGSFDSAKVQALANQKAQIQAQLTVAETQIHNQMYQLLTPDQQSQLKQIEARHDARMQKHLNGQPPAQPEQ